MNPGDDTGRIKPRSITTKKKRQRGAPSKNNNQVFNAKELILGSIARVVVSVILAIPLGGFVLGCIEGAKEFGGDVIAVAGAGIAYAFFITIDAFTGIPFWVAFPRSDVEKLENALLYLHTCIYIAAPLLYLILMLRWKPAHPFLKLLWQRRSSGSRKKPQ